MDFGIARMVYDLDRDGKELPATEGALPTGSTWQPHSGSRLVGTLGYLSPEALDGEPADPSFDLWSLGVVLYECLLGARLFAGGEPQQVMTRIRAVRLPDLPPPVAAPADGLEALFRHVLHKARSRRPATALELRRQLQALQGEWGAERG
jgi:serine/threonine protein kinase